MSHRELVQRPGWTGSPNNEYIKINLDHFLCILHSRPLYCTYMPGLFNIYCFTCPSSNSSFKRWPLFNTKFPSREDKPEPRPFLMFLSMAEFWTNWMNDSKAVYKSQRESWFRATNSSKTNQKIVTSKVWNYTSTVRGPNSSSQRTAKQGIESAHNPEEVQPSSHPHNQPTHDPV